VVALAGDHFPELFEGVRGDLRELARLELAEGVGAPGGHLDLDEDAVAIAIVHDPPVLLPVDAREDAVELLEVVVVVGDPGGRLGHAEVGVAAGHALDTGQPDGLAVEQELRAPDLDLADAEGRGEAVQELAPS
jgi:hypothetical protein